MGKEVVARLDASDLRKVEEMKKVGDDGYVFSHTSEARPVISAEGAVAWVVLKLGECGFPVLFEERDVLFELLYDIVRSELEAV